MNTLPKRTGATNLSDDELLLFDMLFDSNASIAQMSSSAYAELMNCQYHHSLDDTVLSDTIGSLLSRKLIHLVGNSRNPNDLRYSLTESGGELWERERRPNWTRYVTTSQKELGIFPAGSIVALCVNELIGRQCLGAMFAAGLITPAGSIQARRLFEKRLVPWKTFSSVCALRCRTTDDIRRWPKPIEFDVYSLSRCWWRSVDELLALGD